MRAAIKRQFFKEMILSRHQPAGRFPFVVVLDHLKPTFNVGKIIRTANAMGVREVHLVGIPLFHPGPSRGALKHTRTCQFETFRESYSRLVAEGYTLYALAPEGTAMLGAVSFPEKTALILGHEEYGLQFSLEEFPAVIPLSIAQFGQVQSLNVSIAMGMASFEYLRQRGYAH